MRKYEVVFMDADNTLFDYDAAEKSALSFTFLEYGYPYDKDVLTAYRKINSNLWNEFEKGRITKDSLQSKRFRLLLDGAGYTNDAKVFNDSYLEHLARQDQLIDDAYDVCMMISQKVDIIVVTNGISKVQKSRIKRSLIARYIKHVIVSEDADANKPDKRFFEYAFHKCNISNKDKVLIVGDSLSADIKGGIDSKVDTCWFNPKGIVNTSGIKPDYEIKRLMELDNLI